MSVNDVANRLKALMIKSEEQKQEKPSEAVIEACDIVLRLTKNTGSTFADHAKGNDK